MEMCDVAGQDGGNKSWPLITPIIKILITPLPTKLFKFYCPIKKTQEKFLLNNFR